MRKFFFFIFLILLFFHTRGIFYSDDGYILNSALRTLNGQIPYKDFHFAYTPLSIYIDALSFKFFGISILASRIMSAIISFITCLIILKISKKLTDNHIFQVLPMLLYLSWGPTHSNFIFPTYLAISTGLVSILFVMNKKYFWTGVFVFLTFLSKQNFGAVIFVCLFFILFDPKLNKVKFFEQYISGLFASCFLFLGYLYSNGSLKYFLSDLNAYTLKRVIEQQSLTTSFFYGFGVLSILKSILYLSPLIASFFTFLLAWNKQKSLIFIPIFCALYYIIGIRPTTDYIHLTPLLSLLGLPFLLLFALNKNENFRFSLGALFLLFIFGGFYTGLFIQYYRWNPRLLENNYFIANQRIRIFAFDNQIEQISKTIKKNSEPNDYIFVDSYNPMFYFVSNRKNPTKFDLLEESKFYKPFVKEITEEIKGKNTTLILTPHHVNKTFLEKNILPNYKLKEESCGLEFWTLIK